MLGGPVDLVVGDLSFISLRLVLAALDRQLAKTDADLVLMVKPQFEVGPDNLGKAESCVISPCAAVQWKGSLIAAALGLGSCLVCASPVAWSGNGVRLVACRGDNLVAERSPAVSAAPTRPSPDAG